MKEFSKHWKASKRPGKQRKYLAKAPLHIKKKFLSVTFSKELRKKYGKRNIPIRKGDTIKITKGKFKKKQGKILEVNTKRQKIYVEGIQVKKMDGSMANVPIRPANMQIIELNLDDKKRMASLNRKAGFSLEKKNYSGKETKTEKVEVKKDESKTKLKSKVKNAP